MAGPLETVHRLCANPVALACGLLVRSGDTHAICHAEMLTHFAQQLTCNPGTVPDRSQAHRQKETTLALGQEAVTNHGSQNTKFLTLNYVYVLIYVYVYVFVCVMYFDK